MACQHEREIRIIITGKTGSGKSSLGNALLRKKIFKTGCLSTSITKKCLCHTERLNGHRITVTDTPGLCDTNDSNAEQLVQQEQMLAKQKRDREASRVKEEQAKRVREEHEEYIKKKNDELKKAEKELQERIKRDSEQKKRNWNMKEKRVKIN
ncbi:unnamed protein product [Mytilus edulis]|uniref:AIG1-type G domain-containing protein n=1 Tax=Mytilus edulis TaxID=6550 RepID=A0A8S3VJP4_MYTED|nr:unnamed protein product [Mytilus edulis]